MNAAHSLDAVSRHARTIQGVWADDLAAGDWVVVRTRNSVYTLAVLGGGRFQVAGGWFAAHQAESEPVGLQGCTWGGHAILTRMVAAPGMCIEFDNGVRTTRVREVRLIRGGPAAIPH